MKLFSVSLKKRFVLSGQVSIVVAKYGSIVIDITIITAACILKAPFSS